MAKLLLQSERWKHFNKCRSSLPRLKLQQNSAKRARFALRIPRLKSLSLAVASPSCESLFWFKKRAGNSSPLGFINHNLKFAQSRPLTSLGEFFCATPFHWPLLRSSLSLVTTAAAILDNPVDAQLFILEVRCLHEEARGNATSDVGIVLLVGEVRADRLQTHHLHESLQLLTDALL